MRRGSGGLTRQTRGGGRWAHGQGEAQQQPPRLFRNCSAHAEGAWSGPAGTGPRACHAKPAADARRDTAEPAGATSPPRPEEGTGERGARPRELYSSGDHRPTAAGSGDGAVESTSSICPWRRAGAGTSRTSRSRGQRRRSARRQRPRPPPSLEVGTGDSPPARRAPAGRSCWCIALRGRARLALHGNGPGSRGSAPRAHVALDGAQRPRKANSTQRSARCSPTRRSSKRAARRAATSR